MKLRTTIAIVVTAGIMGGTGLTLAQPGLQASASILANPKVIDDLGVVWTETGLAPNSTAVYKLTTAETANCANGLFDQNYATSISEPVTSKGTVRKATTVSIPAGCINPSHVTYADITLTDETSGQSVDLGTLSK